MIIDSHAHYDDSAFDEDREEVLNGLYKEGIDMVVDIGSDEESSKSAIKLADDYDFIYAAVGIHPSCVEGLTERDFEWIEESLGNPKVLAIGEIGLDYYYNENRGEQKKWFEYQLEIAGKNKMPIVVHSRDAAADTLDIIRNYKTDKYGIIHCFSYSKEIAQEYLKMGYHLGIGGVITFKNAKKLVEVVECAPLDRLVLETDCPYLAPVPFRGKRNNSSYLKYVVKKIAEIKNISEEEVIRVTRENTRRVYGMED